MAALPIETERSFSAAAGNVWQRDPFRVFFPLGVVATWIGVGDWAFYASGLTMTYPGRMHALVQVQSFLMAFAVGFLFTALPRRTQGAPPSMAEMAAAVAALGANTVALLAGEWIVAEVAYAALLALILQFALRRFLRAGGRRPPAAFLLIPIALLHGFAGAGLVAAATTIAMPPWAIRLGPLLVEQGVFLCLTLGVGSLILPLMGGMAPPADLLSSPRERAKAIGYGLAGIALLLSFVAEALGSLRAAPLVRATVHVAVLGVSGVWKIPGKPGLHRRLAWISIWLMPVGLVLAAAAPSYRVAALHVLFIGGFGMLTFAVATHVSLSHLGLERLALGNPPAVIVLAVAFALSLAARLGADLTHSHLAHLGSAAALWIFGSAVWLAFLGPRLLFPGRSSATDR